MENEITNRLIKFGQNLKSLREAKSLSQRALAALADMEHIQVGKIERGESDVRLSTVIKLMLALEVDANELLSET
ncbi:helix-turn-helix domain-containing protein [Chitinophaga pendula]|uniref:helix-turn-helix domain-containing protein n=1 Tax=Chitinophaga TaxID=79328 RepID=UPI000BB01F78|nr:MULTISPECIES: helix-turn-helix transcriptional regulator [Chitinophaga]ASZ09879.1 transcriptional regulator [Chitinophaga sp. MD30]UCJ07180.1 helix-turn-helix domain-containing protein [Chitinophaga pendula]